MKYPVIFFSKTCWCRSICLTSDGQSLRWVLDLQQSAVWTLQPGPGLLTLTLQHCRTCLNIHGEILSVERKALKSRQDIEFRVASAKANLPLKAFCKYVNLPLLETSVHFSPLIILSMNDWESENLSLSLSLSAFLKFASNQLRNDDRVARSLNPDIFKTFILPLLHFLH